MATSHVPTSTPPVPVSITLGRRVAAIAKATGTPARLQLLRAGTVALAVLFGLLAGFGMDRRAVALADVRQAASQLIALQNIEVAVVRADALASSAYLVGGLEPADQRADYLAQIDTAANGLTEVAHQVGQREAAELAAASTRLTQYAGLVELARANNRLGYPVGAAYQRQANQVIGLPSSDGLLSQLRAVEESLRTTVNRRMSGAHRASVWLVISALALLAGLVLGSLWLAARFRRWINVPLAAAATLTLVTFVIGVAVQGQSISRAGDVVNGSLTAADLAAQARSASYLARSQEALTLINRGNGQSYEHAWQQLSATVDAALQGLRSVRTTPGVVEGAEAAAEAIVQSHRQIRQSDDAGNWDGAVAISVGRQPAGDSGLITVHFDALDEGTRTIAESAVGRTSSELNSAIKPLRAMRFVLLAIAAVIAVLAAAGYGQRLREYR